MRFQPADTTVERFVTPRLRADGAQRQRDSAIAALFYSVATVMYFHTALPRFASAIIGPAEDNMRSLWSLWYGNLAINDAAHSLAFTRLIFFPDGVSLLFNDYSFYNLILSLPLQLLCNLPAVYNILVLHSFVLAGPGAYLLCRYVTGSHLVSLFAGLIFAFCPTHIAHASHHLNIASIQFIPFFILYYVRAVRESDHRLRHLILSSIFYFLLITSSWTWGLLTGFFVAGTYIWLAASERRFWHRNGFNAAAVAILPSLIVLGPWIGPMVAQALHGEHLVATGHNIYVADLAALVIPPPFSTLGGLPGLEAIRARFTGNPWESVAYLGLANLILIAFTLRSKHPAKKALLAGSILFLVLALGSQLHILGEILPVPLPYSLLEQIPVLNQMRSPARAMVFVYLGVSLLSAIGLQWLLRHWKAARFWPAVLLALFALIEFGGIARNTTAVELPAAYAAVTADPKATAIVDIPSSWSGNCRYMMYQTQHQLPIVQGLLPRRTGDALIDELAFTNPQLLEFQLRTAGVSHIVVHRNIRPEAAEPTIDRYRKYFRTVYSDSSQVVFKLPDII